MKTNKFPWQFLLIILTILLPFGLAYWYYHAEKQSQISSHQLNRGIILKDLPSLYELTGINSSGKWLVVIMQSRDCNKSCEQKQTLIKGMHMTLGADRFRVQLLVLKEGDVTGAEKSSSQDQIPKWIITKSQKQQLMSLEGEGHDLQGFIVDPNGRIVMGYAATFSPVDMRQDLKRLLSVSRIG